MSTPDSDALMEAFEGEQLPERLPESPFSIVQPWFDEACAKKVQPNPNAVTLATADSAGNPSARVVLCKDLDAEQGRITLYTNRRSRKGEELAARPRAALVMHWDVLDRQIRIEGPVTESPDSESDAYFRSRRWESRLGAWASDQSTPIGSREDLLAQVAGKAMELGLDLAAIVDGHGEDLEIPRPPHWGGYRVWAERVEVWCAGTGRVHDRARWERALKPAELDGAAGYVGGPWSATRLQP